MARLSKDTWETVRAEREAGATFDSLAIKYKVSKTAIVKKSNAGNWGDGSDLAEVIRRKVTEKVTGIVTSQNPQKKAEAIEAAATKVAAVVEIHKQEWVDHRDHFDSVPEDFDAGKHAKISAEMLKIRQAGESIAHGLDDGKSTVVQNQSIEVKALSDFALAEIIAARNAARR